MSAATARSVARSLQQRDLSAELFEVDSNVALGGAFDRVRILDQDRRYMICEAEGPLSAAPRTA